MDIQSVPLETLHEDPQNARKHAKHNLQAVRASYEQFGQQKPIVVTEDGTILAGNAQWRAAQALGWTHIDVVVTDLAGAQALAFAITDNRTGELAEWDIEALAPQLSALSDQDIDLESLGWSEAALDALLGSMDEGPKGSKSESAPQERGTNLRLTAGQWSIVSNALERLRDMRGGVDDNGDNISNGDALAMLAQEYLATLETPEAAPVLA